MWWLLGCGMEDRAGETAEVCNWMPARLDAETCGTPRYEDVACVDRVLADLSVDVVQMAEVDGVDDPWEIVVTGRWDTRLGTVLSAGWALGALPWGRVDELLPGEAAPEAALSLVLDVAVATGNPDLGATLYNLAANRVRRTRSGSDENAHAGMRVFDRTLFVYDGALRGVAAAGMLAHEARHVDGPSHVDCPWGEEAACDRDESGSWALQILLLEAAGREAPDAAEACLGIYLDQARNHLLGREG